MTKDITPETITNDLRYLQLLSRSFPTIADASTEIINLEAILNLPKGTEHFLSDVHGEYEAFIHVLRNASGAIKRKVNEIFSTTLRESEKKELCTLIYYPEAKLELAYLYERRSEYEKARALYEQLLNEDAADAEDRATRDINYAYNPNPNGVNPQRRGLIYDRLPPEYDDPEEAPAVVHRPDANELRDLKYDVVQTDEEEYAKLAHLPDFEVDKK